MIALILKWISGGGLNGLAAELRQANKDRLDAANNADKIAADARIDSIALKMEAQTRGSASWLPKAVRAAFGAITLAYLGKLVIFDTVLGLGVTNALGGFADWTMRAVVVFYFLDGSIGKLRG
jgi:hypothetical protein